MGATISSSYTSTSSFDLDADYLAGLPTIPSTSSVHPYVQNSKHHNGHGCKPQSASKTPFGVLYTGPNGLGYEEAFP